MPEPQRGEAAEQIELYAIYRKDGSVEIRDQHGRTIAGVPDSRASLGQQERQVIIDVTLESPYWPTEQPHAEIRLRVPLEVEERLPEWMQEYLRG